MIEEVTITAADFNGETWDGCPFSVMPQWLHDAIAAKQIVPYLGRGTDYTDWKVTTSSGDIIAQPGDVIMKTEKGFAVLFHPSHESD